MLKILCIIVFGTAEIINNAVPSVGIRVYKLGNGVSLSKNIIETRIILNPIRLRVWLIGIDNENL